MLSHKPVAAATNNKAMKLPRVAAIQGGVALVGIAVSVEAANVPLTYQTAPTALGSELGLTPGTLGTVLNTMEWNAAGINNHFRPTLFSQVSYYGNGNKLAFWYQLESENWFGTLTSINYMGVTLPNSATSVQVNQQLNNTANFEEASQVSFLSSVAGHVVGFYYSGANVISKAQSSTWAVIFTDYTQYSTPDNPQSLIQIKATDDAGTPVTATLYGIGPMGTPVPEPATYAAVFALGLAGFAVYRRRCQ